MISDFIRDNPDAMNQIKMAFDLLFLSRLAFLCVASFEYWYRDSALQKAQSVADVDREHKRWVIKFGQNGFVDLVGGVVISLTLSIIMKIVKAV